MAPLCSPFAPVRKRICVKISRVILLGYTIGKEINFKATIFRSGVWDSIFENLLSRRFLLKSGLR